jgi:hypothetical protein
MLNQVGSGYPQTPLRTDISTLLQRSKDRGREEFTKLKELIKSEYLAIRDLSSENNLESGLVSYKLRTHCLDLVKTALNTSLRQDPLFVELDALVAQRENHWQYNFSTVEPRFSDGHVDLHLPNNAVGYELHPTLEARYNSFLEIAILTQTLQWNSESLVIMGQEMDHIFQDANSKQEGDHFTTVDYYWYNALINAS